MEAGRTLGQGDGQSPSAVRLGAHVEGLHGVEPLAWAVQLLSPAGCLRAANAGKAAVTIAHAGAEAHVARLGVHRGLHRV